MEKIIELAKIIKQSELSILELEKDIISFKEKLIRAEKLKEEKELEIKEQVVFDSSLKNAEQREVKLKKLLSEDEVYQDILQQKEDIEKQIKDIELKIKETKIEFTYNKRLYAAYFVEMLGKVSKAMDKLIGEEL